MRDTTSINHLKISSNYGVATIPPTCKALFTMVETLLRSCLQIEHTYMYVCMYVHILVRPFKPVNHRPCPTHFRCKGRVYSRNASRVNTPNVKKAIARSSVSYLFYSIPDQHPPTMSTRTFNYTVKKM